MVQARLGDLTLFDLRCPYYLNHAAISPPSRPVQAAVRYAMEAFATAGSGAFGPAFAQKSRLKARLGRLLGARPEDLALTTGTSFGVSAIALTYPWRQGDTLVLFEGEFPTNTTPWQQAARAFGVEVAFASLAPFAQAEGPDLSALEALLSKGARLVAVSAVQFQTGLRMPLKAMADLCHAYGAELFVDAIQAAGVTPLDLRACGVDYAAGGAHKWLMGTEGAGWLYIRPGLAEALVPRMAGWLSHPSPLAFLLEGPGHLTYDRPIRREASAFEMGSLPTIALMAMEAAISLIEQIGVLPLFNHLQQWHDALEPALVERGLTSLRAPDRARRSGNLCFKPPEHVSGPALAAALAEEGVVVAGPDGLLRITPHWPNALDQVPGVIKAMDRALKRCR